MADLKIDQARAKSWIKDVQNELALTEGTLDKAKEELETFPGEDDTVFLMVEKTNNLLNEAWSATTKAFNDAWSEIDEGLDQLGKAGERVKEAFNDFQAQI